MMDIENLKVGLSFDDVLLLPAKSDVLPSEVDVSTLLTPRIPLNIPIVSAAMDTVTEAPLAIAMAQEGGIGIIHRNLSIEEQCIEVNRVKRSVNGVIIDPITLSPDKKVREAMEVMSRYHISGLPVIEDDKLVGILTNRDLMFKTALEVEIREVMTKETLITAPVGTTLEEAKAILDRHRIEKLPLVDRDGHLRGLITIKDIRMAIEYPRACKDEYGRLRVGAAVGTGPDTLTRVERLQKAGVDCIVIDTAHGHSQRVIETLSNIKAEFPDMEVIAGNVATEEAVHDLARAKADAIKVGVGPGSICTTRVVTGVGVPQLTAIMECVKAAQQYGIPIIADGGIRYSGDVTKAIAVGAQSVMIGNLFAGTAESPGEIVLYEGRSYKAYRGMGSLTSMKKGSHDRYFKEPNPGSDKTVPEGIEGRVPYRGPLSDFIFQLVGGLKAGMGYCGARTIPELQKKARLIRSTGAALSESHPHTITITKEAPNYQRT